MTTVSLAPLDLAALMSSRICHDVISPVGAIVNGLEVLEGEEDADMRSVAMDLIKKSAISASARLQFCRLAFGASGSLGASVDTGDAENVARGLIGSERTTLKWNAERRLAPKNAVKLLLNLCLIAAGAAPRGGVLTVDLDGEGGTLSMRVEARGANVRLSHAAAGFLSGAPIETVDAHSIQPYYTTLLARECGMAIKASTAAEVVTLTAAPAPHPGVLANPSESLTKLAGEVESVGLTDPVAR
ncbi:MAG: histidine phosphotransferase [Hyphomicrobiales bacterium]|nr:histidine phosphotransferase [Hyphomicrobiales bacterium]